MLSRIMNFVPFFLRTPVYYLSLLIIFSAISGTLYYKVLHSGQFLFDDYDYILNNPSLLTIESFKNFTDPRYIGYLSFFLNIQLDGLNPYSFHLANIAIHTLNALLVYLLIALLMDGKGSNDDEVPSWWITALPLLTALIFLCHPLATQSVSYITQRFTSLTAFFYLLSTVLYLTARYRFERAPYGVAAYLPYLCSLVVTVLAMKTKEIAFTIPFLLLLLELFLFRESFFRWRRLVFLIPFVFTLMIIPLSIYGPQWGLMMRGADGVAEITRLDKIYDMEYRSRYEYFITQSRVIMTYLRLLLFPWPQRVIYDFAASRTFWSPTVIFSFMAIAAMHLVAIVAWAGAHFSSGRTSLERRLIAFGIIWFFLTISIESSLIPIKDLIFEHRTYLPSIGFFLIAAIYLLRLAERFRPTADVRFKVAAMTFFLVAALGGTTYARNQVWTSELALWEDVVKKAPDKAIGYHNRGLAYSKLGYMEEALNDLDITISYFSRKDVGNSWESADLSPFNRSKAYVNRSNIRAAVGDNAGAADDNKRAQELFTMPAITPEPSAQDDRLMQINDYASRGEHQKALDELNKLLSVEKNNPGLLINRGNSYSALKRYDEALEDFNRVIGLSPNTAVTYHNRALVYVGQNKEDEAKSDLKKACSLGFRPSCEAMDFIRGNGGKFPGS